MQHLIRTLALSVGSLLAGRALSQNQASPVEDWPEAYFDRKAETMTVLTAWGGANVLVGSVAALTSDEKDWQPFHLMNAGWGAINAALGIFGRSSARRSQFNQPSTEAAYADLRRTEKILLFNAGLDVAYVAGGALLLQRSRRDDSDTRARDRGWGEAVVLQGAALFAFDLLAYRYLHRMESRLSIEPMVRTEGGGVRLGVTF